MILITFFMSLWGDVWIIISCKYSLYTKGILIKYLNLLLLISVFLIKLNRLSPWEWSLIITVLSYPWIQMQLITFFFCPFLQLKSHPDFKVMLLTIPYPFSFCWIWIFKVALMAIFSESSNISLSHLNYITCYFLYYLLKTINTFSLLG